MPRQYTTRRERKRLWCAFFLLLALAAFLLWQELSPWEKAPAPNPPAAGLTLRVIDVGQAQSLLLTCGEDAILVDAGEYAAGGKVLAALSRAGVRSLSATIVTHPHSDHYGGMRTVLEKTPAAAFYTAAVPESQLPTTQSYEKLLSTLSEQAIPAAYLFAGDTIPLGDATVTVLSPARGATWENLNNYSLVLRVTYGNAAFLLMGDAEAEVEETILAAKTELAADVLVVGHHGSATSSSENFLKAVAPRYAILSVGEDNSYNLPIPASSPASKNRVPLSTAPICRAPLPSPVMAKISPSPPQNKSGPHFYRPSVLYMGAVKIDSGCVAPSSGVSPPSSGASLPSSGASLPSGRSLPPLYFPSPPDSCQRRSYHVEHRPHRGRFRPL